jgi:phosphoglycolate phosphatase
MRSWHSAAGILAGFRVALAAGGVAAPDEVDLRIHLGPPLQEFLALQGVSADRIDRAARAYHDFYLVEGLRQAVPYPGIAIGGTDATRLTKAQTLARVLTEIDADPATTVMVGDRHHDIEGAHGCGVRAAGALWGYGVADELARAGADWLVANVADLRRLLRV